MEDKIVKSEMENIEELVEVVGEIEDSAEEAAATEKDALSDYTEFEISGLTPAQRRRKEIFDKITTGILILLMASPIAILAYIFLWFVFR